MGPQAWEAVAFHDTSFETMAEHRIHRDMTERKAKSMTNPVYMRPVLPQTFISVPGHGMHLDFTPQFQGVAAKKSIMLMSSQSQGAACQAGDKRVSTKETFWCCRALCLEKWGRMFSNNIVTICAKQLPWLILLFRNKDLPSKKNDSLVLSCSLSLV